MNIIANVAKKQRIFTIEKFCALYVILWIFVPPVQVGSVYRLAAVACAALWLFCVTMQNKSALTDLKRYLSFALPCMALMIIQRAFAYSFARAFANSIQFIIIVICGIITTYYMKYDRDFIRILLLAAMIAISIFCVTTIQGLIEDPYAARIANSEWLSGRFEGNENVGLYGYIYMCVIIAPMLLYLLMNKIKVTRFFDLLVWICFILISVMTVLSGYMIAMFCYFLGCGLVLVFNKRNSFKFLLFIIFGIFVVLSYEQILSVVFSWLLDVFGRNLAYYEKICNLRDLFLSGDVTGITVAERMSDYMGSLKDLIRYPIIGSYLLGSSGRGGHSSVLDSIGKFGWLVSYLYFFILWKYPFEIYRTKYKHTALNLIIIVVILFGVFDPYTQELCIPIYLFFPYILYRADMQKTESKSAEVVAET